MASSSPSLSKRPVRRSGSKPQGASAAVNPDPFQSPLSVFENEILYVLAAKPLPMDALKKEMRAYGATEFSEWLQLDTALPAALNRLTERGWVKNSGDKYGLTHAAQTFVGSAEA